MARITLAGDWNTNAKLYAGTRIKAVNLVVSDWHAVVAGGAPLAVAAAFNQPLATEADRIPEITLGVGSVDTDITLTGTWNSAVQTETISASSGGGAGATTKGTKPFDTITSMTSTTDPVGTTLLSHGDSYADTPTRWLHIGTAGDVDLQLSEDTAVKTIPAVPAGMHALRVERIGHDNTTAAGLYFVW